MNPKVLLALAVRKSLTFTAGGIICAWITLEHTETVRAMFASSATGLVSALIMLFISSKSSLKNVKETDPVLEK